MTEARDFSSDTSSRPKHIRFRTDPTFANDDAVEDPPENYVMENIADHVMRPRAMSHHLSSTKVPSRKWLTIQARFWRACMGLGMVFHNHPSPKPPKPSFIHKIQTDTIPIELYFYVPSDYHATFRDKPQHRYPVVVNFHGGGFCLGRATDDRYYARIILQHTSAVFVSVEYRRAPEHPFPIPVDDSVEALLYLAIHADDYHIDPSKIALTGFSAGANLSLTVPFRLTFHTDRTNPRKFSSPDSEAESEIEYEEDLSPNISSASSKQHPSGPSITTSVYDDTDTSDVSSSNLLRKAPINNSRPLIRQAAANAAAAAGGTNPLNLSRTTTNTSGRSNSNLLRLPDLSHTASNRPSLIQAQSSSRITRLLTPGSQLTPVTTQETQPTTGYSALKILTIVSWYPLLDWTSSRNSKRRSAVNPAKTLNPLFTDLFDDSYLPPPDMEGNHVSPYASPGLAPDVMLLDGLPSRIQLWLCEYDMLLAEGKQFSDRLEKLGKDVQTTLVEGVPHGWDKSPNPFRDQSKIDHLYIQAAERLEEVFREAERKPDNVAGERIGLGGRQ